MEILTSFGGRLDEHTSAAAYRLIQAIDSYASGIDLAQVYRRESLAPGEQIDGPAIIQEYASTTALFPQDRVEVTVSGELLIHVGGFE